MDTVTRVKERLLKSWPYLRSIFMGNMEVPTNNQQVIKMPLGTYEFGANLVSNQVNQLSRYGCL